MSQEPHRLDRVEIFYEEVGTTDYSSTSFDDSVFLEEVELLPPKGLNESDLPLLTQDLDNPSRFDDPPEPADFE